MNRSAGISGTRLPNRTNLIRVRAILVTLATILALAWPLGLQAKDDLNLDLASLTVTDQNGVTVDIGTFDPRRRITPQALPAQ